MCRVAKNILKTKRSHRQLTRDGLPACGMCRELSSFRRKRLEKILQFSASKKV